MVAKGKNKASAKSNCYEIKNLNQNFPICQVLFLFYSFWIFMLISTNSSRRVRCRNILVEKNDNKVHLHYLKKKKWNEISLLLENLLSNMWKRSRWKNEREIFYTVRDMLKKIVLEWEAQTKLEISMTTLIPEGHLPRQISSNSVLFWAGIPLTGTLKCKLRKVW